MDGGAAKRNELRLEYMALSKLMEWPGNPKDHDLDTIGDSYQRFGFVEPIVLDENTKRMVAGHGRREKLVAWKGSGKAPPDRIIVRGKEWMVPVLRGVSFANAHEAEAYLLTSNQTVINGGYNASALVEMLQRHTEDANGIGWRAEEITDLIANAERAVQNAYNDLENGGSGGQQLEDDDVPEPPKDPITKAGDVWLLGKHRLVCGDNRMPSNVQLALAGETPFIMVTDPPYGVDYDPEWRKDAGLNNSDRMGVVENDHTASWRESYRLFPGTVAYVWCGSLSSDIVAADLDALKLLRRSLIIWAKPSLVISRGHYHWQHETCWYAVRKSETSRWAGDRKQSTLWQIATKDGSEATIHSTQKPVECMGRPMRHHGQAGDHVYEPFAGSGTTFIAAEQLNRICHGLELSPAYCDVIVERWQNLTGNKARRLEAARATPRLRRRVSRTGS